MNMISPSSMPGARIWNPAGKLPRRLMRSKAALVWSGLKIPNSRLIKLDDLNSNDELLALLGRLTTTLDEDLYLMAVRQAIACSDTFKSRNDLAALSPLVELLAEHANDVAREEKPCGIVPDSDWNSWLWEMSCCCFCLTTRRRPTPFLTRPCWRSYRHPDRWGSA